MRARVLAVVTAAVGSVVAGGGVATAAPAVCAPPEVSIAGVRHYEGSEGGTKSFAFTVTMAPPEAGCPTTGSVRYRTVDGSADAGQDYVAATSTLSWTTPGPRVVAVQVARDDAYEPDETFTVELFGARGVTIAADTATATVLNDDASALGIGVVVAVPAGGICWWPSDHCTIPVHLNTIARAPVTLSLRTVDGTAVGGKDYVPIKKQVVTIPTGADHVDVPVELLSGAAPGQYFGVEITDVNAGTIGVARGRVTLREG
ncbi:Calx-beta domain-containing protein [Actinophytocola oryzae]|uniref:Calx-beta domain-containing protein n=1 Tax=Actinophytocola oryzae TaxID=502181 RepID=A0A4R7V655_9PSEU|nr:Calx-beta domain-containing protein [Actinophytocola oryzae]TDV44304.1 Calx-beta domain-containing protein [Actinophytocola oryzae]